MAKALRGYAGLAWLVRGSSRRIMNMRFRPANISLINRRHYLPRLLLTLSSFEKNDQRILTGHYISLPVGRQSGSLSHVGLIEMRIAAPFTCANRKCYQDTC